MTSENPGFGREWMRGRREVGEEREMGFEDRVSRSAPGAVLRTGENDENEEENDDYDNERDGRPKLHRSSSSMDFRRTLLLR